MKSNLKLKTEILFGSRERIYLSGLLITMAITLKEVISHSYNNFQIFSFGSLDFWSGNNPYMNWNHISLLGKPLDTFLYGPLFSILFTPFALLPGWLGPFFWNAFTYTLFCFSIFSLPPNFDFIQKRFIFLYSILLLFATLLSLQFNPVVAALFLFSYTLLEKNKGFWAVLLIMISGFTKVYGIFQVVMILFYPGIFKRATYCLLIGGLFILLPVVKIPLPGLMDYYQSWFSVITGHLAVFKNCSIFRLLDMINGTINKFAGLISMGVYMALVIWAVLKVNEFRKSILLRTMFLGVLMGWVILFSTGSERHTYVIAVAGYSIWYSSLTHGRLDKILLWINFILLGIIPIDIFCPGIISDFLLDRLFLNVFFFAITWGIMVYRTITLTGENIYETHRQ